MKNIYICCGNGVNASTIIELAVKELCEKNGIEAKITKSYAARTLDFIEANDCDLVVSNGKVDAGDIPVVVGLPYLIGIGKEKCDQQILDILLKDEQDTEQ